MKKLTTALLLSLVSLQALAIPVTDIPGVKAVLNEMPTPAAESSDFACKENYERRIYKIAPKIVLGAGVTAASGAGMLVGGGAAVLVGASIGAAPFLGVGIFAGYTAITTRHLRSHLTARNILVEAHSSREETIATLESAARARMQEKLDNKINKKRRKNKQVELSLDEYLEKNPLNVKTPVEILVEDINKKLDGQDVSYDEVVEMLKQNSQDRTFCEGKDTHGKKELRKFLVKRFKAQRVADISTNDSDRSVDEVESDEQVEITEDMASEGAEG